MDLVREILRTALFLYFLLLIGRLIFEWVQVFAREWRPRGPVLVVAEGIYTATDPPLKALRRVIDQWSVVGQNGAMRRNPRSPGPGRIGSPSAPSQGVQGPARHGPIMSIGATPLRCHQRSWTRGRTSRS